MYFFYFDESGSRDPSVGTRENPKDHIYVLCAVGMFESQWVKFDKAISSLKIALGRKCKQPQQKDFQLAECEVKSNWIRSPKARLENSPFLCALHDEDRERLVGCYYEQIKRCNLVLFASVIDKRYLWDYMTHELLHKKAYEFLLERIEQFMKEYHSKHNALIVMDDTSKELNRAVAMKHAYFLHNGNENLEFRHIVEYPFFTRSELSNGVQLADLLAYNIYRAFRQEDFAYPYFSEMLPYIYRRRGADFLDGLKVWPEGSPLVREARARGRISNH